MLLAPGMMDGSISFSFRAGVGGDRRQFRADGVF
jgi:hypothetical protein